MIVKRSIRKNLRGAITKDINAKLFLKEIEKSFDKNEHVKTGALLNELETLKFNRNENMMEHIVKMSYLGYNLKILSLNIPENYIVYIVLFFLPSQWIVQSKLQL